MKNVSDKCFNRDNSFITFCFRCICKGNIYLITSNNVAAAPSSIMRSVRRTACESISSTLLLIALSIKSFTSTPRSLKNKSGSSSNRAPTPYSAAATCLQSDAQSGHVQLKRISRGEGNSPALS